MLCVYAFELADGSVKIGVTSNLENRIQAVASARKSKVLKFYHTEFTSRPTAFSIEAACLRAFADRNLDGEFFLIDFFEAVAELDKFRFKIFEANLTQSILDRARTLVEPVQGLSLLEQLNLDDNLPPLLLLVYLSKKLKVSTDFLLGLSDIQNGTSTSSSSSSDSPSRLLPTNSTLSKTISV